MGASAESPLRIALAQLDLFVGDVDGNAGQIVEAAHRARAQHAADLVVFPELALSGYPPEDLLFHSGMRRRIAAALERLRSEVRDVAILVGYPEYAGREIFNSAALIRDGVLLANHRKQILPNYKVFDEKRYFSAGGAPTIVELGGSRVGLLICEDIWEPEPARAAAAGGAQLLVVVNASPYEIHKQQQRETVVRERVREVELPIAYANLVGGQDELVFDGHSFVMSARGEIVQRAAPFAPEIAVAQFQREGERLAPVAGSVAPLQSDEESVYGALVLGVRDYVRKHRFPGVVMGLSGGVDSALTLAIAVDALGADRVHAVMMPSRFTSQISIDDAAEQAERLGVTFSAISIEGMFEATLGALAGEFAGRKPDTTEENIQSRCRGVLLMAISNKTGRMLLTTGNKSEMAVGYATLYGDMAGGFAPIKDCSKLLVYRLARYRNAVSGFGLGGAGPVIPQRVLTREPTAELRADQKDTDSLPPYEVLDPILEAFIEEDLSVDQIEARGFDRAIVIRVLEMVRRNEYKRRQAPPGVRVSRRAFGRDWRYPITNGYR
ncbi:MAG TPA: NAD+ synthase [Steroidobacteraceae bacterium]|nr:NAD+ synthase [Steroidobacteraceae bacterium]